MPRAGGKLDQEPRFLQAVGIIDDELERAKQFQLQREEAKKRLQIIE